MILLPPTQGAGLRGKYMTFGLIIILLKIYVVLFCFVDSGDRIQELGNARNECCHLLSCIFNPFLGLIKLKLLLLLLLLLLLIIIT